MPLARIKLISDILASWVGVAALLGGGIFGIQQYLVKEEGDRVKETLNFLDRYHQEPFVSSRMKIYQAWHKYRHDERRITDAAVFDEAAFRTFINETIKTEELTTSIDLVTDFYAALEICVTANVCDEDLALLLFHTDAMAHFNRHFPYIESLRIDQNDPDVASRLEHFKRRKIPSS